MCACNKISAMSTKDGARLANPTDARRRLADRSRDSVVLMRASNWHLTGGTQVFLAAPLNVGELGWILCEVCMTSVRQSEASLRVERIDRSQHQTENAAGRQRESSASSKPTSALPLIFCFIRALPSSCLARSPSTTSSFSLGNDHSKGSSWAEDGRSAGERKKGEHLVCRALISTALGEQALPTFPHKTHAQTHARIFSHSNTGVAWPLANASLG